MGDVSFIIQRRKIATLNAHHIPSREYQKLDLTIDVETTYPIISSIYGRGVVIYLLDRIPGNNEDVAFRRDFPVLYDIVGLLLQESVYILDLDEEGEILDEIKLYDWNVDDFDLELQYTDGQYDYNDENDESEDDGEEVDETIYPPPYAEETQNDVMDWIKYMEEYIEREQRLRNR